MKRCNSLFLKDFLLLFPLLLLQGQMWEAGAVAQTESRLLPLGEAGRDLPQPHHDHVGVQLQHQAGGTEPLSQARTPAGC